MFAPNQCLDCGTRCVPKKQCQCCVDLAESRKSWEEFHEERRQRAVSPDREILIDLIAGLRQVQLVNAGPVSAFLTAALDHAEKRMREVDGGE